MKISCERCSAQYDLDENRIPPSGMTMKCPACLHQFTVRKSGATVPTMPKPPIPTAAPPPPKPREIELSNFTEDEGPTPLPDAAPGLVAPNPDEIDLPAPKEANAPDLPAPKSASRGTPIAPPKIPGIAPPKAPPPIPVQRDPRPDSSVSIARHSGPGPDDIDLPAPVDTSRRDILDLPAPKSGGPLSGPRPLALHDDEPDLVAPKDRAPQVGISLDAPDLDDLPATGSLGDDGGPPGLDLDHIDVVAPKMDTAELPAPKAETLDVAPKAETLDVTPRLETHDVAFQRVAPPPPSRAEAKPAVAAAAPPSKKTAAADEDEDEEKPKRGWARTLGAVVGVLLLLGGVGVALGMFTGFGQRLLHRGPSAQVEQQMMSARRQMADDTLGSYRKAALGLQSLIEQDPKAIEVASVAAQARLGAAHLGVASELREADKILGAITDEHAADVPDYQKAKALRSTVTGNFADARTKIGAVLAKAPADAGALVYLGWTELAAGDAAAADKAFGRALAAEATRAAALYGDGVAKERLGDLAAAHDLYARALARSPMHFGAAVGEARTGKKGNEAQAAVSDIIDKRAGAAGPKEVGDAWATVGILADKQGRRDEAEDRLKRALALDADNAGARVALSRVQCELKHCADAVEPLKKLVGAQPHNLDARLALVRALVETNDAATAAGTLAMAVQEAPKAAPVLYWQGRVLLAQPKPDREQALGKLKAAIAADPKLIPAYVVESSTFAALGQSDDAVAALQAAQAQATDDPALMIELGEAYMSLNRPADAEARFRAALDKKPDARNARVDLGAALEAQNKLDDARAQYDQVASEDAKYPGVLERQARLAVKQGRKSDAVKLFDEALKQGVPTQSLRLAAGALFLDPTIDRRDDARKLGEAVINDDERSAAGHLLIARSQLEGGHPEEALPEARRAATLADLPEAHLVLARVLESMNKLDQAIAEYNLARRPPVESEAQLGRARILVRMGASKDALAELNALAKDPKLKAQALLLEGDCYSDLQQGDRARHAYEDAVKAAPTSGDAAFKLGRAYHDAGRRRDTITQLERALKLGGDKAPYAADAFLVIGDAHREGHENDAAVKAYKRYLELAPPDAPARSEVEKHISILGGE
ncbi:MAG TPA: tetratricopeptide repeat protein [Polyangia bacterium]|nr:tetratricopeptide repeat protein [Polyangia bacterium]